MKKQRTERLVVVIGRNRRVYARVYKLESYIPAFLSHCVQKEGEKAAYEGFYASVVNLEKSDETTMVYRVSYVPMPDEVVAAYRAQRDRERCERERERRRMEALEMRARLAYAGI